MSLWSDPDLLTPLLPEPYCFLDSIVRSIIDNSLDEITRKDAEETVERSWENVKSVFPQAVIGDIGEVRALGCTENSEFVVVGNAEGMIHVIHQEKGKSAGSIKISFGAVKGGLQEKVDEPIVSIAAKLYRSQSDNAIAWLVIAVSSPLTCNVYHVSTINWVFCLVYQFSNPSTTFGLQVPSGLLKSKKCDVSKLEVFPVREKSKLALPIEVPVFLSSETAQNTLMNPMISPLATVNIPLVIFSVAVSPDCGRLIITFVDGSLKVFSICKAFSVIGVSALHGSLDSSDTKTLTFDTAFVVEAPKRIVTSQDISIKLQKLYTSTMAKFENDYTASSFSSFLSSLSSLSMLQLSAVYNQSDLDLFCTIRAIKSLNLPNTSISATLPFNQQLDQIFHITGLFWQGLSPILQLHMFLNLPRAVFICNKGKVSEYLTLTWSNLSEIRTVSLPSIDHSLFEAEPNATKNQENIATSKQDNFISKTISLQQFHDVISCIAVSSCGNLIAVGLCDGTVIILQSNFCHRNIVKDHSNSVSALYFYKNKFLVSGSIDGICKIYKLHSIPEPVEKSKADFNAGPIKLVSSSKNFPTPIQTLSGFKNVPLVLCAIYGFESVFIFDLESGEIIGQLESSSDPKASRERQLLISKYKHEAAILPAMPHLITVSRENVQSMAVNVGAQMPFLIVPRIVPISTVPLLTSHGDSFVGEVGWKLTNKNKRSNQDIMASNSRIDEVDEDNIPEEDPKLSLEVGSASAGSETLPLTTPRTFTKFNDGKTARYLLYSAEHVICSIYPFIADAVHNSGCSAALLFTTVPQSSRQNLKAIESFIPNTMDDNLINLRGSSASSSLSLTPFKKKFSTLTGLPTTPARTGTTPATRTISTPARTASTEGRTYSRGLTTPRLASRAGQKAEDTKPHTAVPDSLLTQTLKKYAPDHIQKILNAQFSRSKEGETFLKTRFEEIGNQLETDKKYRK